MPRYIVGSHGASGSTTLRSSCAISRPRASASRSTVLVGTSTPARSRKSSWLSSKLTKAATCPFMRVTAGDSEVPANPRASSRGQKPALHSSQW